MASMTGRNDHQNAQPGIVEADFTLAIAAGTTGVTAATSTFPGNMFATFARTGTGIITVTLNENWAGWASGTLTIINSGSWLAAIYAQWSQTLPFDPTPAGSKVLTIHVGYATILADPGAAYGITGSIRLRRSSVSV